MSVFEGVVTVTKKLWPARLVKEGVISARLVVLGLVGVALLIAGSLYDAAPVKSRTAAPADQVWQQAATARSYEEALEAKLANLLSQVRGAGAVAVNITLENGSSQEFAKNTVKESRTVQERDTSGGTRTTSETKESEQVLLSRESGVDRPVIVREMRPAIKGVLVVAEGAADSGVKASLTRAVEAGLGIPSYKITV